MTNFLAIGVIIFFIALLSSAFYLVFNFKKKTKLREILGISFSILLFPLIIFPVAGLIGLFTLAALWPYENKKIIILCKILSWTNIVVGILSFIAIFVWIGLEAIIIGEILGIIETLAIPGVVVFIGIVFALSWKIQKIVKEKYPEEFWKTYIGVPDFLLIKKEEPLLSFLVIARFLMMVIFVLFIIYTGYLMSGESSIFGVLRWALN